MNAEWSQIPKVINDLARRIFVNKYIRMSIFCYLIMISQLLVYTSNIAMI